MLRKLYWTLAILVAAGALAMRLPSLANRPVHGDEAVHMVKCWELHQTGRYRYDPNEFHGPTLYYATLPILVLRHRATFGDTAEADYRLVTVVFGVVLVLLPLLITDGLGRRATLVASALLAVSPAFVFYSRYYIQEMLLATFTLAAIGCGWRYARSGRRGWLVVAGACAGLMVASKETAPITFVAAAIAFWFARSPSRRSNADTKGGTGAQPWNRRDVLIAAITGLLIGSAVLSAFGTNLAAPLDYVRAYTPWLHRAGTGAIHRQPWSYYLSLLLWTHRLRGPVFCEALILVLGLVGIVAAFVRPGRLPVDVDPGLLRFLAAFTVILTIAYSLIPYKTPWCVLSFLLGFALVGGVGAVSLLSAMRFRTLRAAVAAALLATWCQLGAQAYRVSFLYPTDARNPYAYAQPVPDVIDLGKRVEDLARAQPEGIRMLVKVISVDEYYWPLPWYLRRLSNVGYWTQIPADPSAPVVLASPEFDDALTKRLDPTHLMTGYFGLRPGAMFEVWVRMDVWKRYLTARGPVTDP